jgi:hypothetical protein
MSNRSAFLSTDTTRPAYQSTQLDVDRARSEAESLLNIRAAGLFCIATVLYAIPGTGLFKVLGGFSAGVMTAMAVADAGGRLPGAKFTPAYPPGSRVLLYRRKHGDHPNLPDALIIGFLPDSALTTSDTTNSGLRLRHIHDTPPRFRAAPNGVWQTRPEVKAGMVSDESMRVNYSHGKPLDAADGDYMVSNAFGGGLLISDLMLALKASPSAKIEMFLPDSKVRITSDTFVHAGMCHDFKILEAFGGANRSEDFGFTPFDLLGLAPGASLKESSEADLRDLRLYLDPAKKPYGHRPLARVSRMAGPVFDGLHDQVCSVGLIGTGGAQDAYKTAVAALSLRVDGVGRLYGAREASLLRTLLIPVFDESDFKEEVGEYRGNTTGPDGAPIALNDPAYAPAPETLRMSPREALARDAARQTSSEDNAAEAAADSGESLRTFQAWGYSAGEPGSPEDVTDQATVKYFGIEDLRQPVSAVDAEKAKQLDVDITFGSAYAAIADNADLKCRLLANLSTKWDAPEVDAILNAARALSSDPPDAGAEARTVDSLGSTGEFLKFMTMPPLEEKEQRYGECGQVRTMLNPFADFAKATDKPSEKLVKEDGGDKFKIYGNTCGVRCLEDGSVVLSGGFGEEIRMHRGNIYLTCPGSIYMQPGKDFVAMAPRNAVLKAADGFAEVTSGGVVNVAGGNDVNICAGMTGNTGVLVLESKSKCGLPQPADRWGKEGGWGGISAQERYERLSIVDTEAAEPSAGTGGGVVIRSNTDAALITDSLLVDGPAADKPPNVEMFARDLLTHSRRSMHYLDKNGVMAVVGKDGTSCSLTSLGMALAAPWTSIMTNQMDIYGKTLNTAWLGRGSDGKPYHETVTLVTNPNPAVNVAGTLTAPHLVDASLSAGMDDLNAFFEYKRSFATEAGLDLSPDLAGYNAVPLAESDIPSAKSGGAWSITALFPCSRAYGTSTLVFPEAFWQTALADSITWNEPQMPLHANLLPYSMPWPGYDAWNDPRSYQYIKIEDGKWTTAMAPLRAGYRINEKSMVE